MGVPLQEVGEERGCILRDAIPSRRRVRGKLVCGLPSLAFGDLPQMMVLHGQPSENEPARNSWCTGAKHETLWLSESGYMGSRDTPIVSST